MKSPHSLTPEVRAAFKKVDAILEGSGGEDTPEYREAWAELEQALSESESTQAPAEADTESVFAEVEALAAHLNAVNHRRALERAAEQGRNSDGSHRQD